jgi:hypothetical protein
MDLSCFFCIVAMIRAKRAGARQLPLIAAAETLYNGTAICRKHLIVPEDGADEEADERTRTAPRIQPAPPGTRIHRRLS